MLLKYVVEVIARTTCYYYGTIDKAFGIKLGIQIGKHNTAL